MIRKMWGLAGLLLLLSVVSGCGFRDRQGLLCRFRARSTMPDCNTCMPFENGVSGPMNGGYGPIMAMPCSTPGGTPWMPGMMPNITEIPQVPGTMMPPAMPPPGSATPKPADPSNDQTNIRKTTGTPASKTGTTP